MAQGQNSYPDIQAVLASKPMIVGNSKELYYLDHDLVLVKLIPSLSSFTFNRYENMLGTEVLRLDFFELAAQRLSSAGVPVAFKERVGPDTYITEFCPSPPFEVIVKNAALGSTIRKYPSLFPEGYRFKEPVVKFDFRIDPEDQPIADDYLREAGYRPEEFKKIALKVNEILRDWLAPRDLLDFCILIGKKDNGEYVVISEVSPDCMRLRSPNGKPLDKDLFRQGSTSEEILKAWSELIESLKETT